MIRQLEHYWSISKDDVLTALATTSDGLTEEDVVRRVEQYGENTFKREHQQTSLELFLSQFKSPIIILLLVSAVLSYLLRETVDGIIILTIVVFSGVLSYWQERNASNTMAKLLSIVTISARVLRSGTEVNIPVEELVPGDIVNLSAGDIIPADCRILISKDLFVDQSTLTGESLPVEKKPGVVDSDCTLAERLNTLFMGTHVVSGSCKAVVVNIGTETEFGKIYQTIDKKPTLTDFELGIKNFGYMLLEVTLLIVFFIFIINTVMQRPIFDALLFSLAIAVGLTPQLLPAIIAINLAKGIDKMADKQVIVKQVISMENFGSLNVLCMDKTGTITTGKMEVKNAIDPLGESSDKVLLYAYLNAKFQTGYTNPIDSSIIRHEQLDIHQYAKLDEAPYDFERKRLSMLITSKSEQFITTKGAVKNILQICDRVEIGGEIMVISDYEDAILENYKDINQQGYRSIGVSYKPFTGEILEKSDEDAMIFLGFLTFHDPLKPEITTSLEELQQLGITYKVISGDNALIVRKTADLLGIEKPVILTGPELRKITQQALINLAPQVHIFAEIEPIQKERIIRALRDAVNVVGFMGDGVNDVSALHAADIAISVDNAVDVAKEAAQVVLLSKDIDVLVEGIKEGRKTFSNTLKYIFIGTSGNFGNMISMAVASMFIPFLPLLPEQILLLNLITDFPAITIASDNVDEEVLEQPRKWDVGYIKRFMIFFGIISSISDFLLFFVLLVVFQTSADLFRSTWFMLSIITEIAILFVIRSQRRFYKSRPSNLLIYSSVIIAIIGIIIPYTPLGGLFGLIPIPLYLILFIVLVLILYTFTTELGKYLFYHKIIGPDNSVTS